MSADETQIGGDHYKRKVGQEHWNRAWDLYREVWFVLNITKYTERYRSKDGIKDLKKAKHYLEKLIELEEADAEKKILSTLSQEKASEGKETTEECCPESLVSGHMWFATSEVGTLKCVRCGKVDRLVDPSLVHGMDGRETLCGTPVVDGTYTVYSLYVTCPQCKEKFK